MKKLETSGGNVGGTPDSVQPGDNWRGLLSVIWRPVHFSLGRNGFQWIHENFYLIPGERTSQVGKRPAGLENLRGIFMCVVHQEYTISQAG